MLGPLAVGAAIARRRVEVFPARLVPEAVARRRVEDQITCQRVLGGPGQPERLVLVGRPRPRHALQAGELAREVARQPRAVTASAQVHVARAVVHDEPRLPARHAALAVHLEETAPAEMDVHPDLALGGQEAMVGDHEHRGVPLERARGQRPEHPADQPVDVLDGPARLRRAGAVEVLVAVRAEEV
jgi:hypothetical protein